MLFRRERFGESICSVSLRRDVEHLNGLELTVVLLGELESYVNMLSLAYKPESNQRHSGIRAAAPNTEKPNGFLSEGSLL